MNERQILLVKDCAYADRKFYFIAKQFNLLFCFDYEKKEIILLDVIPEGAIVEDEICGAIVQIRDQLICTPNKTPFIWVYHLKEKIWTRVELKQSKTGKRGILQAFEYKGYLFLVGSWYPAIVRIDVESWEIEYFEDPYEEKKKKIGKVFDAFFRSHYVIKKNYLYLASCLDNSVLQFNLDTGDYKWIIIGDSENRFSGIAYDGNDFWLAPRFNSPIIQWNGNEIICKKILPDNFDGDNNYFFGIIYEEDNVILPNMLKPCSVIIKTKENTINTIEKQYTLMKELGNGLIVSQTIEGYLEISEKTSTYIYRLEINSDEFLNFYESKGKKVIKEPVFFKEGDIFSLDRFIKEI